MFKKRGEKKQYGDFFTRHKLWMASATLMGTVIGAGILSIPYVASQSGIAAGIAYLVVLGVAVVILHLCMGEISLRTKGVHQLPGYIERYLGKIGKHFMIFSMIIGIYGALIAYIIGEGEIFWNVFNIGHPLLYSLIFFAIVSIIISRGIKATGRFELVVTAFMIAIVAAIGLFSISHLNQDNFTTVNWRNIFLPYGVILFAFLGTAAIPELREELARDAHKMKKAILIGSIVPVALYIVFTLIVTGLISASQFNALLPNERIATVALSIYNSRYLGITANIFAALAMFTSFLGLGLGLKEMFEYDLKLNKLWALVLTVVPPAIFALSGLTSFISVIGFTGAVAGGVDGILIMLAYSKAKKHGQRKPEYSLRIGKTIISLLITLFILGILYQLWETFIL